MSNPLVIASFEARSAGLRMGVGRTVTIYRTAA